MVGIRREQRAQAQEKRRLNWRSFKDSAGRFGRKGLGLLIFILSIVGVYSFMKFNPPLELGTVASSGDAQSVVIGIGNKGFLDMEILDISVNQNEKPSEAKIQINNDSQGFIVTDDYRSEEAQTHVFAGIEKAAINAGSASTGEERYGISVLHDEKIEDIHITYSHLGMTYHETVHLIDY